MDTQLSSPLLDLPGELRAMVYSFLFRSTRLKFGKKSLGRIGTQRMKPAANSLAILRSCRQIHTEAHALWLGNVLFDFEQPEDLMDKLSALPRTTLSAIRRVRTGGRPIMITPPDSDADVFYRVPFVLKLLPGLHLDSLTVLGDRSPEVAYQTIEFFIRHGHGWKELHFITRASDVLGFEAMEAFLGPPVYKREPQPQTWNEALLQRDGRDSGASVIIHRAKQPHSGSVLDPAKRELFRQNITSLAELQTFGKKADHRLLSSYEKEKELLIVIKRGFKADISDVGTVQGDEFDLREWTNGMTWAHIRKTCIDYWMGSSDEEDDDREEEDAEADVYDYPEEYQFSSLIPF